MPRGVPAGKNGTDETSLAGNARSQCPVEAQGAGTVARQRISYSGAGEPPRRGEFADCIRREHARARRLLVSRQRHVAIDQ